MGESARYDPTDHEFDFPRAAGVGIPAPRTSTQILHAECGDLRTRHFALVARVQAGGVRLLDAETRLEQLEATVAEMATQIEQLEATAAARYERILHAERLLHAHINQAEALRGAVLRYWQQSEPVQAWRDSPQAFMDTFCIQEWLDAASVLSGAVGEEQ